MAHTEFWSLFAATRYIPVQASNQDHHRYDNHSAWKWEISHSFTKDLFMWCCRAGEYNAWLRVITYKGFLQKTYIYGRYRLGEVYHRVSMLTTLWDTHVKDMKGCLLMLLLKSNTGGDLWYKVYSCGNQLERDMVCIFHGHCFSGF